ncbi:MAG TPA: hypothetical protein VLV15_14030, partial [Dongiaceae bacterium]|nr:hypothetical protein [Dongiaceae bacterium]
TIWGRVPATPGDVATPPRTTTRHLTAAPNPFTFTTRLGGAPGDEIALFDTGGRRVRSLRCAVDGAAVWDGRDDTGRALPSGLYLARARSGAVARVVRIE